MTIPAGPARGTKIVAMGHYQPAKVLTNEDLTRIVDTTDEWITTRVGIKERRVAEGETVADMATAAAGKALANAGLTPYDIDQVIVATCSSIDRCPNVACRVANNLGITAPAAFDLNTGCSGFEYALATADHAIRAGAARRALVIGSEKLTDVTDYTDRTSCILFGDAAGAAVVEAVADDEEPGIGPVLWGSDPSKGSVLTIEGRRGYIKQDGPTVFRWTQTELPKLIAETCRRAGVEPAELGGFVAHQANLRIIEPLAAKLGATNAVVARDIVESGNTSAASVPLALSKLIERGEIASGAPVLLFGFGGGLTYAGQIVRCP
ncbi:3-oxoacyl-[acyl-carrier-protein] synthase 3 protein 4 [Actinocatenispora thailandica]|uniref:Beta-ketoacyl-[acyl-carrier-protein] synthase III n=1 Tax=Actinocatenispora thailandica TaxID=227318 RepID=A0A7R7DN46_9ACTN|nr:beta-ketoacyl-ACP synthase III [Actinocatenispora thailandica]BCJ34490.1 3-oxoacyl-[acyl-carrier-protein] synthase 3 protein 4 [Actinocatenispora thailandica]